MKVVEGMTTIEAALWLAYLAGAQERTRDYDADHKLDAEDERRLHEPFRAWIKEMTSP
jgi:hypothetical protein